MSQKIIKVLDNTELQNIFDTLERSYYELDQSKIIIDFIMSKTILQSEYDFYWNKMLDIKIDYEKNKYQLAKYITQNYNDVYEWKCNFYDRTIILTLGENIC